LVPTNQKLRRNENEPTLDLDEEAIKRLKMQETIWQAYLENLSCKENKFTIFANGGRDF